MAETCGGCVYDGRPLDDVRVVLADDGRIMIGGPVLSSGYRLRPDLTAASRDGDFLLTADRGRWIDERLEVLGRLDEVVITGGLKVDLGQVERPGAGVGRTAGRRRRGRRRAGRGLGHPDRRGQRCAGRIARSCDARSGRPCPRTPPRERSATWTHCPGWPAGSPTARPSAALIAAEPGRGSTRSDDRHPAPTDPRPVAGRRPTPDAARRDLAGARRAPGLAGYEGGFRPAAALLALLVSVALQIGVNYANDYSDGIRGTDAVRVGPLRLVGSGLARPAVVRPRRPDLLCGRRAGGAGPGGASPGTGGCWPSGAACVLAAWYYTGGRRPYGYLGLGELFVFVFFGLVAVCGTAYVQVGRVSPGHRADRRGHRGPDLRHLGGQQPPRHRRRRRGRQAHPGHPARRPRGPGRSI